MANQHYIARYNKFIDALKQQSIDGYYELHHIIPKSSGGTDDKSNLIALTARQHFIAHWILWKAYGGNLARAFFMMSNFGKYGKVNSKVYASARKDYSEQVSIQMTGKVMPPVSNESRQKMRDKKLGRTLSEETKQKLRLVNLGKKRDEEFCRRVSEAKKGIATRGSGYTQSEETKRKIAESNFNRPMITCPHCLKTLKDHGGAKRWHFNNCREQRKVA
jgi:hypothetical protein